MLQEFFGISKAELLNRINNALITRCYNIANCLELAERALLKKKFHVSKYWFDLVYERSSDAALMINEL